MKLVPFSYNVRSLFWRRSATALTIVSVGATVAVVAGILALQQGFRTLFSEAGRDDVAVFLRPGSTSEATSGFPRSQADVLLKTLPEIATVEGGHPLASAEMYLAIRMRKVDGGETNVPIRGVQPRTLDIAGAHLSLLSGRLFEPGTDEVMVGRALVDRIQGCRQDAVITLNTTPMRVVGVFAYEGPHESEIWGDVDRLSEVLERPVFNRLVAVLEPGTDVAALSARLEKHKEAPAKVLTEREYLAGQTGALSGMLLFLGGFLGAIMGTAAIFTGTNTMLAAISARTHEIGVLLSLGFRPFSIFLAFLLEALLLGILGGAVGCLLVVPLNGVRTGTTNWDTFTEVAFAFRITPVVLGTAVAFAVLLGLVAGAWPAWRAARMRPTEALRRV